MFAFHDVSVGFDVCIFFSNEYEMDCFFFFFNLVNMILSLLFLFLLVTFKMRRSDDVIRLRVYNFFLDIHVNEARHPHTLDQTHQ